MDLAQKHYLGTLTELNQIKSIEMKYWFLWKEKNQSTWRKNPLVSAVICKFTFTEIWSDFIMSFQCF